MSFSPLLVTNQGLEALAEVTGTGATLVITKVEAGSGYQVSGDIPANFTALKTYVMDADSTSTNTAVLYQSTIRCNITSTNAPNVFQINELGVFASLNNQAPFLFAYSSTGAATGDTVDPGAPIVKEYVLPIVYATTQQVTTSITMTDVVGLHGATHLPSGVDPLPIASSGIGGLCPKTPNDSTQVLLGGSTAGFAPLPLHGPTHVSTGRDPVPVATTAATGLLPKLSGNTNDVLIGTGQWGAGFFPGFITEFGGSAPPAGWLVCDGQAYSRSTYAALYTALGGTSSRWGQGDGFSTFNVPDLRGRVSVGAGLGAGLTNRALGSIGGEENHTLSLYEMPVHNHSVTDYGHAHSVYDPSHSHSTYDPTHTHNLSQSPHGHSVYDPGHSHQVPAARKGTEDISGDDMNVDWPYSNISTSISGTGVSIYAANANIGIAAAATGLSIYSATTGIAIYSSGTGISIQSAGSGWAHNNMMPYAVLTRIIHI
jgi:microcystin-dependent protein